MIHLDSESVSITITGIIAILAITWMVAGAGISSPMQTLAGAATSNNSSGGYCGDGVCQLSESYVSCPQDCEKCSDSDGGINPTVAGSGQVSYTFSGQTYTNSFADFCVNSNFLTEYNCPSPTSYFQATNISCNASQICQNGACVPVVTAVCGNGVVEPGEQCDLGANNGACPAACSSTCTLQNCTPAPIVVFNATPSSITSGQSVIMTWSSVYATSCTSNGVSVGTSGSGTITPTSTTTYYLSCTGAGGTTTKSVTVMVNAAAVCGNGIVESGEQCDGANLSGATCSSLGFTGGSLSCTISCSFNTAACTNTSFDTTPPQVNITGIDNAPIRGNRNAGASASDASGVAWVKFYLDSNYISTDTTAPYNAVVVTTTVPDGTHTISATAADNYGNTATAYKSVIIDNTQPAVSITAPASGSLLGNNTTTIQASASDLNGISKVVFYSDSSRVNSNGIRSTIILGTDTTAPYSIGWNPYSPTGSGTYLPTGQRKVWAVAYDRAGNTRTSAAAVVNVY